MKRLTKKKRIENEKALTFLVVINCLIVLFAIFSIVKLKNYDDEVKCKKVYGHWCNSYELGKMED